ncbi:MAG: hydroxyacylglutathione hydrolase [Hyphomicrobiaceae bacterium]|nr:hydroxyacylglutathione hydrolase [Hyphomicrobiaceae bacterium]
MNLEFEQFACLSDNYGVLVHDPDTGVTASIDAPDAAAVEAALDRRGWRLTHILVTHHHADHTGGILPLKGRHKCEVVGPRAEATKIAGLDRPLTEGDLLRLGAHDVAVLATPGHTAGHIAYWIPAAAVAFVGDTMFAMGCGRLFEGTAEQMWASLSKLAALPPETVVYCGHEYTASNARFALSLEPGNAALVARAAEVAGLRAEGRPTLPTTIASERATNPFLRADEPALRAAVGLPDAPAWQVFAEIRRRKDVA